MTILVQGEMIRDWTEEEITEALLSPECQMELWWALAWRQPLTAQGSPLYPLLTLESPERWLAIEAACIEKWAFDESLRLPAQFRELFAADCAERALPIWEAAYPQDQRPRAAIEMRRRFATGQVTQEQWYLAAGGAQGSGFDAGNQMVPMDICYAANAAGEVVVRVAMQMATYAVAHDGQLGWRQSPKFIEEARWQLQRVREYLAFVAFDPAKTPWVSLSNPGLAWTLPALESPDFDVEDVWTHIKRITRKSLGRADYLRLSKMGVTDLLALARPEAVPILAISEEELRRTIVNSHFMIVNAEGRLMITEEDAKRSRKIEWRVYSQESEW